MKHVSGYTNSARFRALEDLQKDSADLCLSYCGWEYCDPGHRYGPNMRTTYVLHIIRSGRGTLEIHNQKYVLTAGDAFLLSPNMEAWYEETGRIPGLICGLELPGIVRRNMWNMQDLPKEHRSAG